ncbi:ATP-dependent nuclease [Bacillus velezensis]|uniref:ATP-dependent nuclease n=1 Tax=Bacillus TaxID=1386 RepID=UPI0004464C9C|nr:MULTISPECIES: AAA family ATPase [Bacillus amyloliquefaciens group]AXY39895.1 ATP-dependent endonuclease [Bacillus velezensis]EYB35570.1 DNA recombinase [Bacillus amyloliquefaciens EBL11]MEC0928106.1 AAA family ATPase [Bacillus velezensis]MEC0971565.1 AAA family ATPase [Bacillus velezensis]NYZ56287.1 AAA family ATPase [Bacillus amyloliquefaciens]
MIKTLVIQNFKCFKEKFVLDLKEGINILVGNNEAGKSTILEAIHLVLTGVFRGKSIKNNLTQYMFNNAAVAEYIENVKNGTDTTLPEILIELYFDDRFPELEGDKYSEKSSIPRAQGISITIQIDENYRDEYNKLVESKEIYSLPIEYYEIVWRSFARKTITSRSIPIKSALIDVGFSKFSNGSDMYISRIIQNSLEIIEKNSVSQSFRKAQELFMQEGSIQQINEKITNVSSLSNKKVELSVDLGTRSSWEGSLITRLDSIPFDYVGKGEQAIIKTELALKNKIAEKSSVILIEEPESHISHTRLNQLISNIKENYGDKQIIVSTHSSFVSNKLGLDNLILVNNQQVTRFNKLSSGSKLFFEKIAGYDTLRFILCKKAILVEGDSDELIVQKAYMSLNNSRIPIQDGIEVISVGTSFLRFLEIADELKIPTLVITDNDGDIKALERKYDNYIKKKKKDYVYISYEENEFNGSLKIGKNDYNYNTLEPAIIRCNTLDKLNSILETDFKTEDELRVYMKRNKTECALKIFQTTQAIEFPAYILKALEELNNE